MIVFRNAFCFVYFDDKEFFLDVFFLMMYVHIILNFLKKEFQGEVFFDVENSGIHHVKYRIFHLTKDVSNLAFVV